MKIGVFSEPHNDQAGALCQSINNLAPDSCRHFTLPVQGTPAVALGEEGVYWDGVNVAELDLAYIHGFSYANPVAPQPLGDVDWSIWQTNHIAQQQTSSFLYSAFAEMERRGVKLFNPPSTQIQNFMKTDLLEDIRQAGFQVPRMVCTNDMDTVQSFVGEIGQALWRPATGRAAWQLFLDKQRQHLISPRKPPVLLAEAIEGPAIRGYLLDGKPLLCLMRKAPAAWPLETLEVFQGFECPEVYEELQRLAERVPLRWGQVLFIPNDNRAWIYDIDADPIFEWLPEIYRQRLTEGLARGFLGMELQTSTDHAALTTPQARPTLFLRRMLQILFEFEQGKYRRP